MLNLNISGGLERPEVTFDQGRRACVTDLAVYQQTGETYEPLWAVEAAGRRCVMLRQIVYGQTPTGFTVKTPAAPLRVDGVYEVMGGGMTTHPLSRVPWRGGASFHFHDGQWRVLQTGAEAS